jgi:antitoxin HicB
MKNTNDYLQRPYARIVIPTDQRGFHAEILEFPGCYAQGATLDEAYRNLEKAAESWIEACIDNGQEIPEPSSSVGHSGRIAFRLPKSLHRQAAKLAERDRSSLNTYLVSAVAARVGAEEFYNVLARRLEHHLANFVRAVVLYQQTSTTDAFKNRVEAVKPEKIAASADTVIIAQPLLNAGSSSLVGRQARG